MSENVKAKILELLMELGYGVVSPLENMNISGLKEWLLQERQSHINDIEKITYLLDLLDQYEKENDNSYIKVKCFQCNGSGYITRDNNKMICGMCRGRGYVWGERLDS